MGCYIWYREEGPGRAWAPPSPLLAVPNVTAHPSTASVPVTVLLYNGPLLCGFSVGIKGLLLVCDGRTGRQMDTPHVAVSRSGTRQKAFYYFFAYVHSSDSAFGGPTPDI